MKTRQLINATLSKHEMGKLKFLTVSNLAWKMLHIFGSHIGMDNEITKSSLFKKIFGRPEQITLADELRWEYVKKAMHLIRIRTKCFIASRSQRGTYRYFVVSDLNDAQCYIDCMNRNIKAMEAMKAKVLKSVEQGWHKMDWIGDVQKTKSITCQVEVARND